MCRLIVHVEGQTEETFVNDILRDHLREFGYSSVVPRIFGNSRQKGGVKPWPVVKKDISDHLKHDPKCISTIIVDYYGMPDSGNSAWPGRNTKGALKTKGKAETVKNGMLDEIQQELGKKTYPQRFIPYVAMHEFEGLLFSDCKAFAKGIAKEHLEGDFQKIRKLFETPEDINDSPVTAPSKRILEIDPAYNKPLFGTLAILEIEIGKIRRECQLFDQWLTALEGAGKVAASSK